MRRKRWQKVVTFLAAVVVFCTTYALILPAITLQTVCGYEEHNHEAACYENQDIEGLLICMLEEHIHTDICYEKTEESENTDGEMPEETVADNTASSEEVISEESVSEETAEENLPEDMAVVENITTEEVLPEESTENVSSEEETIEEASEEETEESGDPEDMTEEAPEEVTEPSQSEEIFESAEEIVSQEIALFGILTTEAGDEITWELIPNASGIYTLKVSGDGAIPDNFVENVPELAEEFANGTIDKLVIGKGITSIGQDAFYKLGSLESIDIEEGNVLETIGAGAFKGCTNLTSMPFEKCLNLKRIEGEDANNLQHGAFTSTALKEINFPESLEYIGGWAFAHNKGPIEELRFENMDTIGWYAFNDCGVKKITINNVDQIIRSFVSCYVEELVVNNVTSMFQLPFGGCKKLRKAVITNVPITNGQSFSGCTALTEIVLDNVAIGNSDFSGCTSLKSVTLINIKNKTVNSSSFVNCTALEEIDLTGITRIHHSAFKNCTSLKTVNFDGVTRIGNNAFLNCTSLTELLNCDSLTQIEYNAFDNALQNVKHFEYTRETFPALKTVGTEIFLNNGFEELTIGADIPVTSMMFGNSKSLSRVNFEQGWDAARTDLFDGTVTKFDSVIESTADTFYGENLQTIAPYTSNLYFTGPNYLTITAADGGNGFPEPVNSFSGSYYADEYGVLYLLDDTDNTAVIAYCPPNLESYTVPASIPKEDAAGNYTVVSVGANAFALARDLTSVTVGAVTAETKEDAAEAFNSNLNGDTALSAGDFAGTALGSSAGGDDQTPEADYTLPTTGEAAKQTLSYDLMLGESGISDILQIVTSAQNSIRPQEDADTFAFYTGEYNNTNLVISPKGATGLSEKVFRIYMASSAPGLVFEMGTSEDGESYMIDGYQFIRRDLGNGSYYIDLPTLTGENVYSFPLNFRYTSPDTPGGTVYLWGAILDKSTAEEEAASLQDGTAKMAPPEDEYYQRINWTTKPDEFEVTKTAVGTARLVPSDGLAAVSGVGYEIFASRENRNTQQQNIGEDYVTGFTYKDTITLPVGISWREGLLDAVAAGNWTLDGTKLLVSITDPEDNTQTEYTIAEYTLTSDGSDHVSMESFAAGVSDGKLEISWKVNNTKTDVDGKAAETEIPKIKINLGNNVLIADLTKIQASDDNTASIANTVSMTPVYTWQQTSVTTTAEADMSVNLNTGTITLTKKHNRSGNVYWGEDVKYTITLKNDSVLNASGYGTLEDTLDPYSYIDAEVMQQMFAEDTERKLSIQITNATLYEKSETKTTATAVDGLTEVTLQTQNTGAEVENHYSGVFEQLDDEHMLSNGTAVITFSWDGDRLMMDVKDSADASVDKTVSIGEGLDYPSIQDALDDIGYAMTVHADSRYIVTWDVSDIELAPGEALNYELTTTIKDTFMQLSKDVSNAHNLFNKNNKFTNNVILKDKDGQDLKSYILNGLEIKPEVSLAKTCISEGRYLDSDFELKDGSIVDFSLKINHMGTGTYEVLPAVDRIQGATVLLVNKEENAGASWASNLPTETIDGVEYYVLSEPGSYENVKIGDYWAHQVNVSKTDQGLDTLIQWYFTNTAKRAYTTTVPYKMLVSRSYTGITDAIANVVTETWLNDHQSHRLYASMYGMVSALQVDKQIKLPTGELVKHSEIEKDTAKVTYQLTLYNDDEAGDTFVTGSSLYDALPNTYEAFIWEKGTNVEVSYSDNTRITNGDHWNMKDTSPMNGEAMAGQYYLCWDDDVLIYLPKKTSFEINVTLTFPTDTEFEKYIGACNGNKLYNLFYAYHMSSSVTHDLEGVSSARLQKGVYDVAQMSYRNYSMHATAFTDAPYISTGSRHVYGNSSARACVVTYYVVLHNDGTNRLYLNPTMDSLPKGFYLGDTVSSTQIGTGASSVATAKLGLNSQILKDIGNYSGTRTESDSYPLASIASENVKYLKTDVTVKVTDITKDGTSKISITFAGQELDDGKHYDSARDQYYLLPGEAIRFGYCAYTNVAALTEDIATNVIMMPFTDYVDGGLNISETPILASDANGLNPNDGGCEMISDDQAAVYGFTRTDGDTNNQWLASDVTVTRGSILPGIRKSAAAANARMSDPLEWEVTVYNDGTAPMNEYVITDEMESPYKFMGDVYYEIYAEGGFANGDTTSADYRPAVILGSAEDSPAFTIVSNELSSGGEIVLKLPNNSNLVLNQDNDYTADIISSFLMWNGYQKKYVKMGENIIYEISFHINDAGNQVLQLRVEYLKYTYNWYPNMTLLGIPAGGYGKLKLSAENLDSGIYLNKTFYNNAWVTPFGAEADFENQPIHGNATTSELDGTAYDSVVSNAIVNVSSGIFTTAEKRVTEAAETDTGNTAVSTDEVNYIMLKDQSDTFRYDLSVTTPTEYSMQKLVLIDNLPQPGDYTSFGTAIPRYSEFEVSFAADPDISVTVTDKEGNVTTLTSAQYEIGYSEKTVSKEEGTETSFDASDWDGSSEWSDTPQTDSDGTVTSRSIRLVINDPTVLTLDSTVTLSFNAVIHDEDAEPGQIAWNSFGYHYEVKYSEDSNAINLEAAPLPVGIKFPSVPVLVKELRDPNGNEYITAKDETFSFLVYKGEFLQELEAEGADIEQIMNDHDITQYDIQEITVAAGTSRSEKIYLKPETWQWEDGASYTVLELPFESTEYEFGTINHTQSRSYTFTYRQSGTQTITSMNRYRTWDLLLIKSDDKNSSIRLADAAFALYSPIESDAELYQELNAMTDTEKAKTLSSLQTTYGIENDILETIAYAPSGGSETAYYLKEIIKTGSSGVHLWSDLLADGYLLTELRAPNGYNMKNTLYYVEKDSADYSVEISVTNEAGYELPESGGSGIGRSVIMGILLITGTALWQTRKKFRKIRKYNN